MARGKWIATIWLLRHVWCVFYYILSFPDCFLVIALDWVCDSKSCGVTIFNDSYFMEYWLPLSVCYLKTDTSKGYSKTINLRASLYSLGFTLTILLLQVYSLPCVRKCNPPCSWIFGYSFLNHRSLQPSSFALNQCGSFTRMFLLVRCDSATLGASKKCNKCSSESMCSFTLPFTLVFRVLILYRWTAFPFSVPNFLQY